MAKLVLDALLAAHPAAIEQTESMHGDEIAWVKKDQLVEVATWLKTDPKMAFDAPVFVTCIDRLDWHPVMPGGLPVPSAKWTDESGRPRFEVCYQLRSTVHRHRLRIKVGVTEA